jgi:hypothetical protein
MKRKLRAELIGLASRILSDDEMAELPQIYQQARELYEKLAVLNFIEEKLQDLEVDVNKSMVASKFEKMASAVLKENRSVPENNPHEEDIIIPGIDTIKHMVSEMPGGDELEEILAQFLDNTSFVKNDKEIVTPTAGDLAGMRPARSLNDTLTAKEISVGLNDRLAFVKHLFNDSTEDFNRILSQLNSMDSHENSIAFIRKMVKPEYQGWKGKEEYETRFLTMIERRFS